MTQYFLTFRWLLVLLLMPALAQAQALVGTFAAGATHSLAVHADGTLWATGSNAYGQLGIPASTAYTGAWVQVGTATNWVQVAAGNLHSLGLRADGSLYAWGRNDYGQLGTATNSGTPAANPTPTQVAGTYVQVATGETHSLALRADGTLYAWGSNYFGQLGNTTNNGTNVPTSMPTLVAGTYTQIEAGTAHSLGLRADGSLYAWGWNHLGQLGSPLTSNGFTPTPTLVPGTYTQVAAGREHSLGLRADGTLYAWGSNYYGQLGSAANSGNGTANPMPTQVTGTYTQVAAGNHHSLGRRADGTLYAWGLNWKGELGSPINYGTLNATPIPTPVAGIYSQMAAGSDHSLGLRADGTLYAWGENSGITTNTSTPVATGTALPTRSTAAGLSFGLAVKADGTLWAWGNNQYGQLGDGTTTASLKPHQIGTAHDWVQVAAGTFHSLGLRADGTLYAWGRNEYGQLGNATNNGVNNATPNPTPMRIAGAYTQVAAGGVHSLGLRADGTLYAWGSNYYGELGNATGNGAYNAYPTPTQVAGIYTQMAAGGSHSLGLRADGTLYAWGLNNSGQLGSAANSGTAAPNPTPTQVAGTYTQAAAGALHSLGLRADGTLYAWGRNEYGQLGNLTNSGTSTPTTTPILVAGIYSQVAAGSYHSLGLRADGILYTWGYNYYGELGRGTIGSISPNPMPTQEATLGTGWTTLAPAPDSFSSLVRTASGLNFASAGYNNTGQLGDGTTTDWPRFDRVSPLSSLQMLPVQAGDAKGSLALYPNPAPGAATLTGAAPDQVVQVVDALGRLAARVTADATGTAALGGLAPGLYLVRVGSSSVRLAVE